MVLVVRTPRHEDGAERRKCSRSATQRPKPWQAAVNGSTRVGGRPGLTRVCEQPLLSTTKPVSPSLLVGVTSHRMTWDEEHGRVTREFAAWKATDEDIRAYLAMNMRWVDVAYDKAWEDATADFSAVFDPDRHDTDGHVQIFHDMVGGLWPADYYWKLRSDNIRDAVTAFEVYAEKSLTEVLGRLVMHRGGSRSRLALFKPRSWESPAWDVLVKVHAALGSDIEPASVQYIRALRHLLAHQRGELRSEEQRAKFVVEADPTDWMVGDAYVGRDVPLSGPRVLQMLGQLGDVVRAADAAAWALVWDKVDEAALANLGGLMGPKGPLVSVAIES